MAGRVPWSNDVAAGTLWGRRIQLPWCLTRCQVIPVGVRWPYIAEREVLLSTRVLPICNQSIRSPTHSLRAMHSPNVVYLASAVSGQTHLIGRNTGRLPKQTRKDGGRGSGSPTTRAFAGSKPPLIASLPVPGHTVMTFIFGDRW